MNMLMIMMECILLVNLVTGNPKSRSRIFPTFCSRSLTVEKGSQESIENNKYPDINWFHHCSYTATGPTGFTLAMKCENLQFTCG